jgi:hypothetical protein
VVVVEESALQRAVDEHRHPLRRHLRPLPGARLSPLGLRLACLHHDGVGDGDISFHEVCISRLSTEQQVAR